MNYATARLKLLLHAGMSSEDIQSDGFLGTLRPYKGLHDENFHQVMEAILLAGESIYSEPKIDRDLVDAIWRMCIIARLSGIELNGPLVKNKLISPQDSLKLQSWVTTMEKTMLRLLSGNSPSESIHAYCEYVASFGWGTNHSFFIPLIVSTISNPDLGDHLEACTLALAALGAPAISTLDALREALLREYDWYEPTDRCTQEMRSYLQAAITAIASPTV